MQKDVQAAKYQYKRLMDVIICNVLIVRKNLIGNDFVNCYNVNIYKTKIFLIFFFMYIIYVQFIFIKHYENLFVLNSLLSYIFFHIITNYSHTNKYFY